MTEEEKDHVHHATQNALQEAMDRRDNGGEAGH